MLLCVSSRESSEVLSAATGEVQVVAGASFKFGDTGAVGVEGLGCGLDTEPCFGASSAQADAVAAAKRVGEDLAPPGVAQTQWITSR